MKGIIEQKIEEFADRTGEYPKKIEVSQKEWNTLQKELKNEYKKLPPNNKNSDLLDDDIRDFRGCRLELNRKLSKFRIS